MSKIKWFAASAAFLVVLSAAPQDDPAGVTVDLNGASLIHRASIAFPQSARTSGVRGAVVVDVELDGAGEVSDARVLSGPAALRKPALESVLQWHFMREAAGVHRQVTVSFDPGAPVETKPTAALRLPEPPTDTQLQQVRDALAAARARAAAVQRTVTTISVTGISDTARAELLASLGVRQGEALDLAGMDRARKAVQTFDEHLTVNFPAAGSANEVAMQIAAPNTRPEMSSVPNRIRVGGNVQSANLVSQVRPVYPPEAKQARIQGPVQLSAIIGKDGTVTQLDLVSGHPMLAVAALDAVKQWVYKPTLLNGAPVEVTTTIDVNFTLSQ